MTLQRGSQCIKHIYFVLRSFKTIYTTGMPRRLGKINKQANTNFVYFNCHSSSFPVLYVAYLIRRVWRRTYNTMAKRKRI